MKKGSKMTSEQKERNREIQKKYGLILNFEKGIVKFMRDKLLGIKGKKEYIPWSNYKEWVRLIKDKLLGIKENIHLLKP